MASCGPTRLRYGAVAVAVVAWYIYNKQIKTSTRQSMLRALSRTARYYLGKSTVRSTAVYFYY